jgi:hypothetical protein
VPTEIGMPGERDFPVVRDLADLPEFLDGPFGAGEAADVVLPRDDLQGRHVLGRRGPRQARLARRVGEAVLKAGQVGEVEVRVAPLQDAGGLEMVAFQGLHRLGVEGGAAARGAEGAVAEVPAGPPGDLTELGRKELAEAEAVELAVGREGDVVDVEVEPHADGVGGHEVVHVAVLVHRHLGVAGAGRERPEHHRRPAALAADQLRDGVDLLRREGDDRRAGRQARNLLLAGEGELGQPRAGDDVDARHQGLDERAHRRRADEQGFGAAALVEDAVGEDVAAVEVGCELDLVHRHEGQVEVARHGLDGGDPVARVVGLDLLLAGDEGHLLRPHPLHHPPVDLAREKPQGQADHAGSVAEHALDGEMGLARVGGAENGRYAAGAQLRGEGTTGHEGVRNSRGPRKTSGRGAGTVGRGAADSRAAGPGAFGTQDRDPPGAIPPPGLGALSRLAGFVLPRLLRRG